MNAALPPVAALFPNDPSLEGRRLYLMRHGETYEPRLDARLPDPDQDRALPLTERGRAVIGRVAEALAGSGLGAVFCSHLARARESAEIIGRRLDLPVQESAGLSELRIDRLELAAGNEAGNARDLRSAARRYVALARALESRAPHDLVMRSWERSSATTLGAVIEEATQALVRCVAGAERTLVVAHGGLNRFLLAALLGLPPARFTAIDQDFACINRIDFVRRGRPWVRAINITLDDPFKDATLV